MVCHAVGALRLAKQAPSTHRLTLSMHCVHVHALPPCRRVLQSPDMELILRYKEEPCPGCGSMQE